MKRSKFINTINALQGFRVGMKNCHWFLRHSANKHKTLDDLIDIITEYTDAFAEEGIMIFGDIELNEIFPLKINYNSPEQLVNKFKEFILNLKQYIDKPDVELSGLNSITDDLIHRTNQTIYRFDMD